jgi:hypothetical protein
MVVTCRLSFPILARISTVVVVLVIHVSSSVIFLVAYESKQGISVGSGTI